jgi:hypothetical protein
MFNCLMSRGSNPVESEDGFESEETASKQSGTTRRRLLASGAATWATVALAGCTGGDDDGDTPTESPTDEPTESPTDEPTETPSPQPENYVVTTETWAGSGVPASVSFMSNCARADTFVPGMQAVFFVGIFDPDTGDRLTSDDLGGVSVNVGDGMNTIELEWTDEYEYTTRNEGNNWVGSWTVPEDMEPQGLPYTIEVTDGDANFQSVGVLSDQITVVEYDDPSNLVVDTDTFWNGTPPEAANGFVGGCAPTENFGPDMDVTFVAGIYDSTSGNMVGSDGLYDRSANPVEDEGSEFSDGIDSVTVVSPDDSFDDVTMEWSADPEADNPNPQWSGTFDTEGLQPGTYAYEIQISDESSGRFNTGIASAQFSIIEVPEQ